MDLKQLRRDDVHRVHLLRPKKRPNVANEEINRLVPPHNVTEFLD